MIVMVTNEIMKLLKSTLLLLIAKIDNTSLVCSGVNAIISVSIINDMGKKGENYVLVLPHY